MMNHRIKQLFVVFISAILLLSQASLTGLQTVYAATLENAVTISAFEEDGTEVLEMTAVEISDGDTAFDVLEKADEHLDYDIHEEYGAIITGINGVQKNDQSSWSFFVNGKSHDVGPSSAYVSHGDNILFVLLEDFPPEYYEVTVSATDRKGNAVIEERTVSMPKNTTAYDALRAVAAEQNVDVDVSIDTQWFTFLNDLNNTLERDCEYWAIDLNGDYMNVGLLGHFIEDGDRLDLYVDNYCEEDPVDENDNGSETEDPVEADRNETDGPEEDEDLKKHVDYEPALASVIDYLKANPAEIDWYGFTALMTAGEDFSTEMAADLAGSINEEFSGRATDYAKTILILTAAGYDATDINGVNLIESLMNEPMLTSNFLVYSLLAIDSADYEVPKGTEWTRESLIDAILEMELDAGGWSFYGDEPSPDITGMALLALSPYQDREDVKAALDRAIQAMAEQQGEKGGYNLVFNGGYSAESAAMVIVGLSALGIDATSADFTKEEANLLEHLLAFQLEDGSFKHLLDDAQSSSFATNQALLALVAYDQMKTGKAPVFKFTDIKEPSEREEPNDDEEANGTEEENGETNGEGNNQTGHGQNEDDEKGDTDDTTTEDDAAVTETDEASESDGQPLPKTATTIFNYLLFGFLTALTGAVLYIIKRKRALHS